MDFSHNNTVLWSVVFILVGVLHLISTLRQMINGGQHKKFRSSVFNIIVSMVLITCGILALIGIGKFVPAD